MGPVVLLPLGLHYQLWPTWKPFHNKSNCTSSSEILSGHINFHCLSCVCSEILKKWWSYKKTVKITGFTKPVKNANSHGKKRYLNHAISLDFLTHMHIHSYRDYSRRHWIQVVQASFPPPHLSQLENLTVSRFLLGHKCIQ